MQIVEVYIKSHKINYSIKSGLIELLMGSTSSKKEEIWANLADIAQVCADRLSAKNQKESWTQKTYPGTQVKVRIDMSKQQEYACDKDGLWGPTGAIRFKAKVKMANVGKWEEFTSQQVEDYIDEVILGGE